MAHADSRARIETVRLAFSAGTWARAHVAEGWAFLEEEGLYVRAYGVAHKWKMRVQALKAALAVVVHMHMALGNDRLGRLWWLQPHEDQCVRAQKNTILD